MALSLRPDDRIIIACLCERNAVAVAIRDEWRPNSPVTLMSTAELEAVSNRASTAFVGTDTDLV
jgi:hypothetical protein